VRGLLLTILGPFVGAALGVLVWLLVAIAVSNVVGYFYPGGNSSVMGFMPSEQSEWAFCVLLLIFPYATLFGVVWGASSAQLIEARLVLESLPHGVIASFREDGTLFAETTYHRGVAQGSYRDYWHNGNVACEGQNVEGLQDGEWRYYNEDGSLRETIRFSSGQEIQA
jgi:hypothetical protein